MSAQPGDLFLLLHKGAVRASWGSGWGTFSEMLACVKNSKANVWSLQEEGGTFFFFFGHAASCSLDRPWCFEVQAWGSLSLTLRCFPGIFTHNLPLQAGELLHILRARPGLVVHTQNRIQKWLTFGPRFGGRWGWWLFLFLVSFKSRSDYPEREQIHLRWISCYLQSCWFQPWIVYSF